MKPVPYPPLGRVELGTIKVNFSNIYIKNIDLQKVFFVAILANKLTVHIFMPCLVRYLHVIYLPYFPLPGTKNRTLPVVYLDQ